MIRDRDYELSERGVWQPRERVLRAKRLIPLGILSGVASSVVPIALIAHAKATPSGGDTITSAIDTTGSTVIIAVAASSQSSGGAPTITGSKSNTFTALTSWNDAGSDARLTIYYSTNGTYGSGHTFESPSSLFQAIFIAAFNLTAASPFDVQNGTNTPNTGTTHQPGSVTPTNDNSLIITGLWTGAVGSGFTIGSGFSITDQVSLVGGNNYGGGLAWLVQGAKSAVNPTWTTPNIIGLSGIAVFKHS